MVWEKLSSGVGFPVDRRERECKERAEKAHQGAPRSRVRKAERRVRKRKRRC